MEYLIIAFGLFAVAHFVWESILAPTGRIKQRFALFALRDDLRALKARADSPLEDRHFYALQDSINSMIRNVEHYDIATMSAASSAYRRNKELQERVAARTKLFAEISDPEAVLIRKSIFKWAEHAVAVNNGALAFYLVPVVLLLVSYKSAVESLKRFLSLSESDSGRVVAKLKYATIGVPR